MDRLSVMDMEQIAGCLLFLVLIVVWRLPELITIKAKMQLLLKILSGLYILISLMHWVEKSKLLYKIALIPTQLIIATIVWADWISYS